MISSPALPPVRAVAMMYKPGATIEISGNADGASFQRYYVEWNKGISPGSTGWSSTGMTLTGGGLSPITGGTLATWNSSGITQADYYTIRLRVAETSLTNTVTTYVYLEPDLLSTNWPRWLDQSPLNSCPLRARTASGETQLILVNPPYLSSPQPSRLWRFSADGASVTIEPLDKGSYMQPAAGNLDAGSGDDVVVGEWNQLRVLYGDGSEVTLPRTNNANCQHVLATLADLDGDGQSEILAMGSNLANNDDWLFAWRTNGQMFSTNYPLRVTNANFNLRSLDRAGRILPMDIDADGIPELLILAGETSSSFTLKMLRADGTPMSWPNVTINGEYFHAIAGDLNGDGQQEIVLAYEASGVGNQLAVYSKQGVLQPGWPIAVGSGTPMHALIADLNRDGTNEIVATAFAGLFVFKADGTKFPGAWPIQGNGFQPYGMPAVADIDGDGIAEIIVARDNTVFSSPWYTDLNLFAYRTNASIARSWHLLGANGNQPSYPGAPLVGDFDGDGFVDIALNYAVVSGGETSGGLSEGVLTVLRLNAPYRPHRRDWPMYFHDTRNSSVGFEPTRLSMGRSGKNVTLSWPLSPDGGVLQYNTNANSSAWFTLPVTVSPTNGQYRMTMPATNSLQRFRMSYP